MTDPLQRITLNLARDHDYPEGSAACGYELVAPLDKNGHLDPDAWKSARERCVVRHFWTGEDDKIGRLVHRPGGAGGARWCIDYDPKATEDDETGYRLDGHAFRQGEYVSIKNEEGALHTFRVADVKPA